MFNRRCRLVQLGLVFPLLLACNAAQPGTTPDADVVSERGTPVTLALGPAAAADKEQMDAALAAVKDLTAAGFAKRTAVKFDKLSYDPSSALGLDLIQRSANALTDPELAKLKENGFVISTSKEFPTFTYGYAAVYAEDLPLFVSADSILFALHRSYDNTLKQMEVLNLIPGLQRVLNGMRRRLDEVPAGTARQDADLFLTVAASLLQGKELAPAQADSAAAIGSFYDSCVAANGAKEVVLFGSKRLVDFSQCKPRGHYTDSKELENYFRAMMWLGNTDLRMIETQEDGGQVFHRRQLEAALWLRQLLGPELETQQAIDKVITAFVGEHDYMTVPQVDDLMADLGVTDVGGLRAKSDQELAQAIVTGGYGTQRISSHYMVNGLTSGTLPLSSSFALFGQRYVVDSHVFSNVVYDRAGEGTVSRMMPNPLDMAYAALGNDQAGQLLAPELQDYAYAPDLAAMRVLVDSNEGDYWKQDIYTSWLGALRTLSPGAALTGPADQPLPGVARTEAWGRRLLNTQLASWAELRHDTILYAKQSYTTAYACEFPDAYVEPYPSFFAAIGAAAERVLTALENAPFEVPAGAVSHYENFAKVAATLEVMAEHQRTGTPHSSEHMAFINDAVTIDQGCGSPIAGGWYPNLFYGSSVDFDPTIADVHTDPHQGQVLHVGTGNARLMVVTIETCEGPRAYAGLASSYYELVTEKFERLDDPQWEKRLQEAAPPAVSWMAPLLAE